MHLNSISIPYVVGTAVTTAILFCGVSVSDQFSNIPSAAFRGSDIPQNINYGLSFDRYQLLSKDDTQRENIEIIHGFASNLLENIEDISADFSQAVDENFWDLI